MITKKSTKGKITIELKSSGHHFTLTKNTIRGLHGSLLTSEDDTGATLRITSSGPGAVTTALAGAEASITSSEATDTPSFEGDVVTTSLDLEGTQISITASELTDTDVTSTTKTFTETPVTSSHNEDRSICITPPGDDEKMRPRSIVISSREDLVKACQDIDADSITIKSSESTDTKAEDDADETVSITSSEASDINVTSTTDTDMILSNVPFGATAIPPNDVVKTSTNAAISIAPSGVAQIHPQSTESTSRYSKSATSFTVMPFGDRNAPTGAPHAQPMKIHVHVHVHMH